MTETISVVIPVFNNRSTLVELASASGEPSRRNGCLSRSWSMIARPTICCRLIIDILRVSPPRVVAVQTPRNLGQHGAILVGLSRARGTWCAVLDADLQDRPEAIADLLAAADGCDVVSRAAADGIRGRARL